MSGIIALAGLGLDELDPLVFPPDAHVPYKSAAMLQNAIPASGVYSFPADAPGALPFRAQTMNGPYYKRLDGMGGVLSNDTANTIFNSKYTLVALIAVTAVAFYYFQKDQKSHGGYVR
jgi:hypothetical protein